MLVFPACYKFLSRDVMYYTQKEPVMSFQAVVLWVLVEIKVSGSIDVKSFVIHHSKNIKALLQG